MAIENRPFKTAAAAILLFSAMMSASQCHGQNTLSTESIEDVDFLETRIRPPLITHCLECHSDASAKTSGGLALDTRQGWQRGSDSGHVIIPGKPDESLLIAAIRRHDSVSAMQPDEGGKPLSQQEIEDMVTWESSY
ncbi:MAG: c-type cytochrome domain-containing protein [Pirellula sp.]